MSKFLDERYSGLAAYVPGEQPQDKQYIKLNTNESPYPPSPEVLSAVNMSETELLRLTDKSIYQILRMKMTGGIGNEK